MLLEVRLTLIEEILFEKPEFLNHYTKVVEIMKSQTKPDDIRLKLLEQILQRLEINHSSTNTPDKEK
ncbi:hypothetical protein DSC47_10200 [Elizabethkingia miricola]|nr:hypothetical protein DSC47_10200 [Elizabethkingia miricola]